MFVFVPEYIPPMRLRPAGTDHAEIFIPAVTYDGVRRVPGLRMEHVVSVKNPTLIPTSHRKR